MRVKRSCLLEDWRSKGQKVVGWKLGRSDLVAWVGGKGNRFWDTIFQRSGNTQDWAWLASEGAREAYIGTKYHWNLMKSKASPWLQPPFRSGALTAHNIQRGDGRGEPHKAKYKGWIWSWGVDNWSDDPYSFVLCAFVGYLSARWAE